jgi:hypothetical protein
MILLIFMIFMIYQARMNIIKIKRIKKIIVQTITMKQPLAQPYQKSLDRLHNIVLTHWLSSL